MKENWISNKVEISTLDNQSLATLSAEGYCEFLQQHILGISPHGYLTMTDAAIPIAANREQLDILIKELSMLKAQMF